MYMRIREITQLTEAVNLRPDPAHVRQLVMQQLPKYAKKSIPIAGWAFMLYDLYVRVVEEKDYKGAMMSLGVDSLAAVAAVFTGGMAGFAVQMVGISALLTRDLYGKIYCLDPKTRQPMLCTPGNEHNTALQLEDDKFPGYEQRREEFQALIKDILDDIANSILSVLPKDTAKISGAQGAANARNALKNSNTAGNPSPALHPERYPK
jgi:hypothetical protein